MPLEPGTLLHDRYRISAVIAEGGMGAVYRAFDENLRVEVAVKENLIIAEEAIRQFHREATLLASLRHPNLPRVTDHFVVSQSNQYLVMDFIEGEDIRQRLTKSNLSEEETLAIGVAVCDALAYLHSRIPPIVHRDIKPGNIKVTSGGQVFLVDFGLAKISKPGQSTTSGAQALTPGYAPPEQYGKGTSPASDIYSLGATLYAALTGKVPEDGLELAMGNKTLTPLRIHNPVASERTAQVIEHAMAVKIKDRYPTASEFRLALLSASSATRLIPTPGSTPHATTDATVRTSLSTPLPTIGTPILPTIPHVVEDAGSGSHSQKKSRLLSLLILIPVILIALVAFGVGKIWPLNPPVSVPTASLQVITAPSITPPPTTTAFPPTATVPAPTITVPPPTVTIPVASLPTPTSTQAPTPSGGGKGQIAFVSTRINNIPQIWLMNEDGSNSIQLTRLPDGACQPDWSPDGKRLVFISPCRARQSEYRGSTLYIINADGTGLNLLPSMPGGDFDPDWSPDGNKIAFTSLRESIQHIFIINLEDNKVTRFSAESSFDANPAWSPDGKFIAFESTRLGSLQIWVSDSAGQNTKMATILPAPAFFPQWSPDGVNLIFSRDQAIPVLHIKQFKDMSPEFVVNETLKPIQNASFSTDGQWIVFESWKNNNVDIYRMAANGSMLTQLTQDPAIDFSPVWRP